MAIREAEKMHTAVGRGVMLKVRAAEGLKAYKEFMKFLTNEDLKNIDRSVKEFHTKFRFG